MMERSFAFNITAMSSLDYRIPSWPWVYHKCPFKNHLHSVTKCSQRWFAKNLLNIHAHVWLWDQNKYMRKGKHPPIHSTKCWVVPIFYIMALPFQSHCWQCAQQLHDLRGDFCQNWAQGVALSKATNDGISLVICIIPTVELMKREQISCTVYTNLKKIPSCQPLSGC